MGSDMSKEMQTGRLLTPTMYRKHKKPPEPPSHFSKKPKSSRSAVVDNMPTYVGAVEEEKSSPLFLTSTTRSYKSQNLEPIISHRHFDYYGRNSPSEMSSSSMSYKVGGGGGQTDKYSEVGSTSKYSTIIPMVSREPLRQITGGGSNTSDVKDLALLVQKTNKNPEDPPSSSYWTKYEQLPAKNSTTGPGNYHSTETKISKTKTGETTTVEFTTLERESSSSVTYSPLFYGTFRCTPCDKLWKSRLARENVSQRCDGCSTPIFPEKPENLI